MLDLNQIGTMSQQSLEIPCSDLRQNQDSEEEFFFFLNESADIFYLISGVWFEPYPKCKMVPIFILSIPTHSMSTYLHQKTEDLILYNVSTVL